MASDRQLTPKAQQTRESLVMAASALLREGGPKNVSYRRVSERAGAASSSVGYYFDSIDDLLSEAADYNMKMWAGRAELAAERAETLSNADCHTHIIDLLIEACLPRGFSIPAAHYEQLMWASESSAVTNAYRKGRIRLNAAISRILNRAGYEDVDPRLVVAVVDGAAVAGLSEGYDVAGHARTLLGVIL